MEDALFKGLQIKKENHPELSKDSNYGEISTEPVINKFLGLIDFRIPEKYKIRPIS